MPRVFLIVSTFLTGVPVTACKDALTYTHNELNGVNITVHCTHGYCTNTSNIHEVTCCEAPTLNLHITTFEIFGLFFALIVCIVFGICAVRFYRKRVKNQSNPTTDSSQNQPVTVVMTTSSQSVVTIHPYSVSPPAYEQVVNDDTGTITPCVEPVDDKTSQDMETNIYFIPPPSYEQVVSGTLPGVRILSTS